LEKINSKMIGVAITPESRREWKSREATRYWIVAPGWTADVEINIKPVTMSMMQTHRNKNKMQKR